MVPGDLQRAVWETYKPGQETGRAEVTPEYLDAADAAIAAVLEAERSSMPAAPSPPAQGDLFRER
jgi:hypothetical protein